MHLSDGDSSVAVESAMLNNSTKARPKAPAQDEAPAPGIPTYSLCMIC